MPASFHLTNSNGPHQPDLDVGIIYTYESHYMPALLGTLARSVGPLDVRLILVDNAADSIEPWASMLPATTVVRNDRRLGYAENLNRILSYSQARYVLLMNTDMHFDPQEACLAKMVAFMDAHPDCGLSICRLFHPDGTYGYPARRLPTWRTALARRTGLRRWLADEERQHLYLDRSPLDTFDCDWVSGCFMLLRRETHQQVGTFDCGFRKYFEDVDMCYRVWLAGWRVMFHGATFAYHHEQRASRRWLSRDAWLHARSYLRWMLKWGFHPQRRLPPRRPEAYPEPVRRAA